MKTLPPKYRLTARFKGGQFESFETRRIHEVKSKIVAFKKLPNLRSLTKHDLVTNQVEQIPI